MKRRNLFTALAGLFAVRSISTAQTAGLALQPSGNEHVGTGDGRRREWTLNGHPFSTSLMLFVNGVLMSQPEDYIVQQSGRGGNVTEVVFVQAPSAGDSIRAYYLR